MSTYTADQDPAEFKVDEVTAFLATAEPTEVEHVKALESAEGGKARKGILEWAPKADEVEPDEDGYTRVLVEDAYQPGEPIQRDEDADLEDDEPQA